MRRAHRRFRPDHRTPLGVRAGMALRTDVGRRQVRMTPGETPENEVSEIFADALERAPEERAGYLDRVCGSDAALRARVDALIAARPEAQRLFRARLAVREFADLAPGEAGRSIGPYRLTALLATGGMGSVYVAERV